nr:DUF5994 family protein [Prauserella shujinwangii]
MAAEPPRLKLHLSKKPKVPTPGYVDGAWWPRSRDLSAELPALATALATRLGPLTRVAYHPAHWDPSARRLRRAGSLAPLGGYRCPGPDTVEVTTRSGRSVTLVVVLDGGSGNA